MGGLTVLYDEHCGFCTALAGRLARNDGLKATPIGSTAGDQLLRDLTTVERYAAVHVVDASGRRLSGGAAVAPLLRALPGGLGIAGVAERLPGPIDAGYRLVARHRKLISRLTGLSGCPTPGHTPGPNA